MTFPFTYGSTITHVDRSTVTSHDAMGIAVRSSVNTTLTQIPFWQQTTTVQVQGQTMLKEETYILLPIGSTVDLADHFIVNGSTYRIDGEPWSLVSPMTGTAPGVLVKLEQVTG